MRVPGFTAEASLTPGPAAYAAAGLFAGLFQVERSSVQPAQVITGVPGLPDGTGIDPDTGNCAKTLTCGPCQRFCVPRFGCFSFKICTCISHNGVRRTFAESC